MCSCWFSFSIREFRCVVNSDCLDLLDIVWCCSVVCNLFGFCLVIWNRCLVRLNQVCQNVSLVVMKLCGILFCYCGMKCSGFSCKFSVCRKCLVSVVKFFKCCFVCSSRLSWLQVFSGCGMKVQVVVCGFVLIRLCMLVVFRLVWLRNVGVMKVQ